jgi:hypothetical protein
MRSWAEAGAATAAATTRERRIRFMGNEVDQGRT